MICQVAPMNIKTCLLLMVFTLGVSVAIPHLDDRIVPEVSEVEVQENTVGPITYYQGNAGTTCPPGQLITSQAECLNTAVNSLDVQAGRNWVGSSRAIPVGCSIRGSGAANHNDFAPHWNRSPSGVGRADLNPICSQEIAVAPPTYYQGNAGTTCPPGQRITSQAECLNTAVNSLDVQAGRNWVGSSRAIPVGCSIRGSGAAHKDFAPHWNGSPSGVGRADLNPVCKAAHKDFAPHWNG